MEVQALPSVLEPLQHQAAEGGGGAALPLLSADLAQGAVSTGNPETHLMPQEQVMHHQDEQQVQLEVDMQQEQQQEQQEQEQQQEGEEQELQQQADMVSEQTDGTGFQQLKLYLSLLVQQQRLQPGICRRGEVLPQPTGRVVDWGSVKKAKTTTGGKGQNHQRGERGESNRSRWSQQRTGVHKIAGAAGRTFTSRFRGVHQTFPTKRWEAQFRRNGKPTSLGCFDQEDEAARAYDRMMLWCEIHGAGGGVKGSVTNFDLTEYEKDIAWLTRITQDDLIEALRGEGRRQAIHRSTGDRSGSKRDRADRDRGDREGTAGRSTHSAGAGGGDSDAERATASGGTNTDVGGAGGGGVSEADVGGSDAPLHNQQQQQQQGMTGLDLAMLDDEHHHHHQQGGLGGLLSATTPGVGGPALSPADAAAAAAAFLASPAAAASPAAMNLLFGSIGQGALAAVQQLQQQLEEAAAAGGQPDEHAAAAAAFQIGQIAGSNLLAALSSPAGAALGGDGGAFVGGHGGSGGDAELPLGAGGLPDEGQVLGQEGVEDGGPPGVGGNADMEEVAAALAAGQGLLLQQQLQGGGLHLDTDMGGE